MKHLKLHVLQLVLFGWDASQSIAEFKPLTVCCEERHGQTEFFFFKLNSSALCQVPFVKTIKLPKVEKKTHKLLAARGINDQSG